VPCLPWGGRRREREQSFCMGINFPWGLGNHGGACWRAAVDYETHTSHALPRTSYTMHVTGT
ncbi:unnamed protein product, partial [Musa acuminata subsp. burmannicoides]